MENNLQDYHKEILKLFLEQLLKSNL
jgi:hypothetical protein